MDFLATSYTWFHQHPGPWLLGLWIIGAVMTVALRAKTPEQWVALAESSPRLAGSIKLVRKIFPDLPGAIVALRQIVLGVAASRGVPLPKVEDEKDGGS